MDYWFLILDFELRSLIVGLWPPVSDSLSSNTCPLKEPGVPKNETTGVFFRLFTGHNADQIKFICKGWSLLRERSDRSRERNGGVDKNNITYEEETGLKKGGFLLGTFISKRKVPLSIKGLTTVKNPRCP
jgi:hypothetical protein